MDKFTLTLKAPITTAADDKNFVTSFLVFEKIRYDIVSDDSHKISFLICYF